MPAVHPYCDKCGWRKGGLDSWNGSTCKCGSSAEPISDFEPSPVFVCQRCGTGFLRRPVSGRHVEPMWFVLSTREQGEDCFGEIVLTPRVVAKDAK